MNSQSDRKIDFSHAKEPPASLNPDTPSEPAPSEESLPIPEQEQSKAIDHQMSTAFIPGSGVTSEPSVDHNP